MPSTERQERAPALFRSGTAPASRPDRLILVYDGDSGLGAMLLALRADLPCVRRRVGAERPFVVVAREEIMSCRGSASALEEELIAVLSSETGAER